MPRERSSKTARSTVCRGRTALSALAAILRHWCILPNTSSLFTIHYSLSTFHCAALPRPVGGGVPDAPRTVGKPFPQNPHGADRVVGPYRGITALQTVMPRVAENRPGGGNFRAAAKNREIPRKMREKILTAGNFWLYYIYKNIAIRRMTRRKNRKSSAKPLKGGDAKPKCLTGEDPA